MEYLTDWHGAAGEWTRAVFYYTLVRSEFALGGKTAGFYPRDGPLSKLLLKYDWLEKVIIQFISPFDWEVRLIT